MHANSISLAERRKDWHPDAGFKRPCATPLPEAPGEGELVQIAQALYRMRRRRERWFAADLFGEPGWDMLLDLFIQGMEGRRVPVGSLCLAAEAPHTTALRWIARLCDQGLIERHRHPDDGRVALLALSPSGMASMRECLANFAVLLGRNGQSARPMGMGG